MNRIFKKMGILLTLIFSFLISIFPSNVVNAGYTTDVVYEKVEVKEVNVNGSTIRVKLGEELDVLAFTYEYAYLDIEGVKVSQLDTCDEMKKLSAVDFSFYDSSGKDLLGVKIWKIQFKETETYRPDWMTTGNNEWVKTGTTGINGSQRLKTLQVTKNKLSYNNGNFDDYGLDDFFSINGYKKEYTGILFFSLDNEEQNVIIDSIYRIEARIVTYENTWKWWGVSQKTNQNRTIRHVHRLDTDTTGCLVYAKDILTHSYLSNLFENSNVKKEYNALVYGIIEKSGKVDTSIGRNRHNNSMITTPNGLNALTLYKPLKHINDCTLLNVEIKTGRTHQIRVHMASIKHPLLGDTMYGKNDEYKRVMLHCSHIGFIHPVYKYWVDFFAEIPQDMKYIIGDNNENI